MRRMLQQANYWRFERPPSLSSSSTGGEEGTSAGSFAGSFHAWLARQQRGFQAGDLECKVEVMENKDKQAPVNHGKNQAGEAKKRKKKLPRWIRNDPYYKYLHADSSKRVKDKSSKARKGVAQATSSSAALQEHGSLQSMWDEGKEDSEGILEEDNGEAVVMHFLSP